VRAAGRAALAAAAAVAVLGGLVLLAIVAAGVFLASLADRDGAR
jgi:hypothetical protein